MFLAATAAVRVRLTLAVLAANAEAAVALSAALAASVELSSLVALNLAIRVPTAAVLFPGSVGWVGEEKRG